MTTTNPDTTAKPASAANGATPGAEGGSTPGAGSAAEPTLKDRSAELRQVARQEQAKLRARETERAERVALEARAKAAEEKAARLDALEERLGKDPMGILSERGVKARDIAERIVKEGTPDAKLEELNAKIAAWEAKQEADRTAAQRRADELQRQEIVSQARKQLHSTFTEMKDKLPILSRLCTTEARIEREYMAAWTAIQSDPEAAAATWTDAEIFEAMEQAKAADREAYLEGSDADVLETVLTKKRASVTTDGKPSTGSTRQATESAGSSSAKTLTNGQAASRTSAEDDELARKPGETLAQWDKRQDAVFAKRLREGRRG
jgi:hypothetical protein